MNRRNRRNGTSPVRFADEVVWSGTMADKDRAATPLVQPYEDDQPEPTPAAVGTDAPVSTDEKGRDVEWPDKGGQID